MENFIEIDIKDQELRDILDELRPDLERYCFIQHKFHQVDVSSDILFQRNFNGFYRVRRNIEWRKSFYKLFEKEKMNVSVTFAEVLREMKRLVGRCEASFVSKLIATIEPQRPIIDKYVLKNFNLSLPSAQTTDRIEKIIELYERLCKIYEKVIRKEVGQKIIMRFNERYPEFETIISDIKRLILCIGVTEETNL